MTRTRHIAITSIMILAFLSAGCGLFQGSARRKTGDPLPSWNNGQAKQALIRFVTDMTEFFSDSFVPPDERLAVLDVDGTLLPEKPQTAWSSFIFHRIEAMADNHPQWRSEEPYRSVLGGDLENISGEDLWTLAERTHGGMTQEEFQISVEKWVRTTEHPRFKRPYRQLAYRPMVELIRYLTDNDFRVFVSTDGDVEFVRAYSEVGFGVPRERVIGTVTEMKYEETDFGPVLHRMGTVVPPVNLDGSRPVNIQRFAAGRPILSVGNSDGDIPMMQFAQGEFLPSLVLLLVHDDAQREFDYSEDSGRLLEMAALRGWITVSMKNDFKTIFTPEKKKKKD